jgi:hypothetical protein
MCSRCDSKNSGSRRLLLAEVFSSNIFVISSWLDLNHPWYRLTQYGMFKEKALAALSSLLKLYSFWDGVKNFCNDHMIIIKIISDKKRKEYDGSCIWF